MRFIVLLFTLLCFSAIDASAKTPDWVKSKPSKPMYYTGVGMAPISGNDYIQKSKELALNDLISEIQIDIESNSLFQRQEINREYFEEFKNQIKTSASASLEGYELVETWNDGSYYWTYYQLDKQEYADIIANRIADATQHAYDFWSKGNSLKRQGNVIGASQFYLKALKQIEQYTNRYLPYTEPSGQTINLAVEIFNSLENVFKDITISTNPKVISFTPLSLNAYQVNILVTSNDMSLKDVPLSAKFAKGKGDVTGSVKTNENGMAAIIISNISSKLAYQELAISLDVEKLGYDNNNAIIKKLISDIPSVSIPLIIEESSLSAVIYSYDDNCSSLANNISNYFAQNYFDIVDEEDSADVSIVIEPLIRPGGIVKGELYDMLETYASCTITLTELNSGKIITSVSINDIRSLAPVNSSRSKILSTTQRDLFKKLKPQLEAKLKEARFSKRVKMVPEEVEEEEPEEISSTPEL
ncbi:MAG: hypothetical protein E7081_00400 [Bacteroidales bacterium]|nr:hypothetical protein [Bacteroidales bacterium]